MCEAGFQLLQSGNAVEVATKIGNTDDIICRFSQSSKG